MIKILQGILLLSLMLPVTVVGNCKKNKVIILGIDGCRPDALMAANTPNIDQLTLNATYSMDALNDGITISGPSWSSILTGVWENKHRVYDNSFNGSNFSQYPHFFKYIKEYNPNLHTVSICQWAPINDQIAKEHADIIINTRNGTSYVEEAVVEYLKSKNPDAIFVQFDDVDGAGHAYGYSKDSEKYLESIEIVDKAIGNIYSVIKQRKEFNDENWLIIITTDHGGINFGHGGNTFEERNIFLICSGDWIPKEEIKKDSIFSIIYPPENCLQDSVELFFDGTSKVTTKLNNIYNFGKNISFSVECRIRTNYSADVAIITDKDWQSGLNKGFVFSFGGGLGPWKVNIGDGIYRKDINGTVIHDNEWHTLSATFDRTGQLIIYDDGVVIDSILISDIGDIYSGFPISIGTDVNNLYSFKGSIAEVRIFNKVISPKTIEEWHCKIIDSTHIDYKSLIGYWRLTDGGSSNIVKDLSLTKADAIVVNAEWKSVNDTLNAWIYDYSKTPRNVDVAVTALEHLCIPHKEMWDLDGVIIGASCKPTTGINYFENNKNNSFNFFKRTESNSVVFESCIPSYSKATLVISNNAGQIVDIQQYWGQKFAYSTNNLNSGIFLFKIITDNGVSYGKFIID